MADFYGTNRGANINPLLDAEMFYYYRPDRSTEDSDFTSYKELSVTNLIKSESENGLFLNGVYNLRLPVNLFNKKGIYTILIRPKEYELNITDVSVLDTYPDIRGIVVHSSDVGGLVDLTGYRIEYYDSPTEQTEISRLITSSNSCEPVKVVTTDNIPKSTRYRLNNLSSNDLLFCTVTPSSSNTFKPNSLPYIGVKGQLIHIINTKFNPLFIELEMVEHDAETIATMVEGDQIRDLDNGLITTYTLDTKEIYKQQEYFTLKNELGTPLFDVKATKKNIDLTQDYNEIVESE